MALTAKTYLGVVFAAGLALLAVYLPAIRIEDPYRFGTYFVLAIFAACLKVSLPGIHGTMSVLFLFLLLGIVELSLPETLLIAGFAALFQSFWHARERPKLVQLTFNVAALVIATAAAHFVYFIPFTGALPVAIRLVMATAVFFVANTLPVAIIIGLTEDKSILSTWRRCYFWSFPYYVGGACIIGLFSWLTRLGGWQTSILVLPIVYLVYRSYRIYFDRLEQGRVHAEQLKAAALRLEAVLEGTTDCVFATSLDYRITYANQRARSRLFRHLDPIGTIFWEAFPKLADEGFRGEITSAFSESASVSSERFFPDLNAWFEVHAYPSADGFAFYLKEVTEQRKLADQLQQAQKMEAIGRLAGGVAHDFNNLLTIILGYGRITAELLPAEHIARPSIQEVLAAGERASALTQRLLAFSRKQILEPVVLNPNMVVNGMENMLKRLIGEDILIRVNLDPRVPPIRADHHQLEQVIMNMAVNARDAMPAGGQLTISTSHKFVDAGLAAAHGRPPGDYSVLSIQDTGCGMDAETSAKIFEPFFTTKEIGKGTGLGLSMVYGTIQQSGGFVTVGSGVGVGSVFEIYLPSVASDAPAALHHSGPQPTTGRGRILLIEDDAPVRRLAQAFLTQAGYSVTALDGAVTFLKLSRAQIDDFDLLVTDMVMPGISGPDIARQLLQLRPEVKVLYVSGYTDHPLITEGAAAGGTAWLQKPFTREELLIKVRDTLVGSPGLQEDSTSPQSL